MYCVWKENDNIHNRFQCFRNSEDNSFMKHRSCVRSPRILGVAWGGGVDISSSVNYFKHKRKAYTFTNAMKQTGGLYEDKKLE